MTEWINSKELLLNEISLINKTVLDVGCGDGWFCYWCLNYGCRKKYSNGAAKRT